MNNKNKTDRIQGDSCENMQSTPVQATITQNLKEQCFFHQRASIRIRDGLEFLEAHPEFATFIELIRKGSISI